MSMLIQCPVECRRGLGSGIAIQGTKTPVKERTVHAIGSTSMSAAMTTECAAGVDFIEEGAAPIRGVTKGRRYFRRCFPAGQT
jgi:hypothetical protein